MFLHKLKTLTAVFLAVSMLGLGGVYALQRAGAQAGTSDKASRANQKSEPVASPSGQGAKVPAPQKTDVLGIGDRIVIEVAGNTLPNAPINGVYQVENSGKVALGPPYGRVKVAGQTLEEAEKTVSQYLSTKLRPPLSVQITRHDPFKRTEGIDALKRRVDELEKEVRALRAVIDELRRR